MTQLLFLVCLFAGSGQEAKAAEAKRIVMGKDVWLEIEGSKRRVVAQAQVCFREGFLELLVCKKLTKEHEAVFSADVDARDLHKALMLCGAEPGKPVQFVPKYEPAKGPTIDVWVEYEKDGKKARVKAQEWVRDSKTKKAMTQSWVFTGSVLLPNPFDKDKPPVYAANQGDIISLSNFQSSMLDLPVRSSDANDELLFEAYSERIPPLGTPVLIILEVAASAKK